MEQKPKEVVSMDYRSYGMVGVLILSLALMSSPLFAQEDAPELTPEATLEEEISPEEMMLDEMGAVPPEMPLDPMSIEPEVDAAVPAMEPPAPAPPVTPPALKPITITFTGELIAVKAEGESPSITVQDRYGVKKEIAVAPDLKVTQGESTRALTDLASGEKLTVEYTYDVATGKRTAQSIASGESR